MHMDCGGGCGVWTVFSASNYSGGDNCGAVLVFDEHTKPLVRQFQGAAFASARPLAERNDSVLKEIATQHRHLLLSHFRSLPTEDKPTPDRITPQQWASAMASVTSIEMDWMLLQPKLAPADKSGTIDFEALLGRAAGRSRSASWVQNNAMQALFVNRKKLMPVVPLPHLISCQQVMLEDCFCSGSDGENVSASISQAED